MNEVEKMYENCNIKPKQEGYCDWDCDCPYPDIINNGCGDECSYWKYKDEAKYPPFTAEKQLNIIKWLLKSYDIDFSQLGERIDTSLDGVNCIGGLGSGDTFEESLAQAINDLWQDLTGEERKQIRGILE